MKRIILLVAAIAALSTSCQKREKIAANEYEYEQQQYRYDHYNPREPQRMRSYPYTDPYQQEEQLFTPQPRKPLQTTPSRFRRPNPGPYPHAPSPATPAPYSPPRPVPPPPYIPPRPVPPPPRNPHPQPPPSPTTQRPHKQMTPVYMDEPALEMETLDPRE